MARAGSDPLPLALRPHGLRAAGDSPTDSDLASMTRARNCQIEEERSQVQRRHATIIEEGSYDAKVMQQAVDQVAGKIDAQV